MNVDTARGIAARAWCTPENSHKTMDPDLAEAMAQGILEHVNNSVAVALDTLATAMVSDEGYRRSWQANLAMVMQDRGMDHARANDGANTFINLLLGSHFETLT